MSVSPATTRRLSSVRPARAATRGGHAGAARVPREEVDEEVVYIVRPAGRRRLEELLLLHGRN